MSDNGQIIAYTPAGNPEEWYGTKPQPYEDRTLLTHRIKAQIPLPKTAGEYALSFYIKNPMGQYARMDNAMEYREGHHILVRFTK